MVLNELARIASNELFYNKKIRVFFVPMPYSLPRGSSLSQTELEQIRKLIGSKLNEGKLEMRKRLHLFFTPNK